MQTKKTMGFILFFLLATVVVAAPVLSVVPDTINFQGMLTDDNGDAVADGSYVMRFYLFDAATGGNQLWNNPDGELQTVTVTNGVYNVQLGINESLDYTIFNGGTVWLEVVVEGETLSPRQPLTSTAYALKAGDADTLAGQTLGDLNTAYVNIGETDVVTSAMVAPDTLVAADLAANSVNASEISTGAVGTLEIANGAVTAADLAEDYVNTAGDTMTGALNLPANGLRVGTSQLVVTGGRIGLGTSSPNEQLELTGNLRLPATTSTTGIIRSGSGTLIHTYGSWNFFAGERAGNLTITGPFNTASGHNALHNNTAGSSNTASGSMALYENTTGDDNTASGTRALLYNTTGIHGTALGERAGYTNTTGNGNTFIGCDSDASADDLINATALGYSAVVNGSNRVRIGNTYVSQIGGNVGWSNLSDIRGKADIAEITLGLDFINSLRPVEFRLIDGNDGLDLGFIAQDIETLLGTGYNILGIGGDIDRMLSLRYTDFIAPMVKAIQEQQAQIDVQQEVIERQDGLITELQSAVAALKVEMAAIRAKQ